MTTALAERAWCVVVPHHARGARLARHRLTTELAGAVPAALLADVVAVVGELVGNAVRHADPLPGGVIRVAWRCVPAGRRRSSRCGSPTAARRTHRTSAGPGGARRPRPEDRAALADRWGVDRDGLGQSVWAELSTTEPVPGPPIAGLSRFR